MPRKEQFTRIGIDDGSSRVDPGAASASAGSAAAAVGRAWRRGRIKSRGCGGRRGRRLPLPAELLGAAARGKKGTGGREEWSLPPGRFIPPRLARRRKQSQRATRDAARASAAPAREEEAPSAPGGGSGTAPRDSAAAVDAAAATACCHVRRRHIREVRHQLPRRRAVRWPSCGWPAIRSLRPSRGWRPRSGAKAPVTARRSGVAACTEAGGQGAGASGETPSAPMLASSGK